MDELNKVQQLNKHLKELERGELKLDELADPEIASLLKLASYLQENLVISSSSGFRQQVKENFLSAWQKKRLSYRRRLVKIIALATSFLLLLSGLANATWKSQPGSLLYPVKKGIEKIIVLVIKRGEKAPSTLPARREKTEKGKPERKKGPESKRKNEERRNEQLKKRTPPNQKKGKPSTPSSQKSSLSPSNLNFQQEDETNTKNQEKEQEKEAEPQRRNLRQRED